MTENSMNTQTEYQTAEQSPALKKLDRLVGTWEISGDAHGQVSYEWMEGGFFLMQRFDLDHDGNRIKGVEIIGHERPFGAEPGEDIKARVYDTLGNTLDYVYELEGDTLTIWGGERGSPAYYQAKFSDDGDSYNGAWVWPGGGYVANATRVNC